MKQHKYLTLDAIRGVAAVFVAFLHLPSEYLPDIKFPHAYLAVDLFFAMSGFVLASAYDEVLKSKKLSTNNFLKLRIIRVYPLYFLALLIWLILMVYDFNISIDKQMNWPELGIQIFFGLLFLPSPVPGTFLFPLNGPAWSLFFELVVNYIYARFVNYFTIQKLWGVIFISALLLVALTVIKGELSFGFTWRGAFGGFVRVVYSFSAGLLIFHYRKYIKLQVVSSNFYSVIALLLVAVLLGMPYTRLYKYFDMLSVLLLFPLILLGSSFIQPKGVLVGVFAKLGRASYGFYVLQYAFIWLYGNLFRKFIETLGFPPVTNLFLLLSLLFIFSLVLDKSLDEPVRKWMRRKFVVFKN